MFPVKGKKEEGREKRSKIAAVIKVPEIVNHALQRNS